ncbi:hypothetical protein ANN_25754 [Periplaneta americana]|uniref:Uncharacterized protein n=1 Tax=Periplaneta americana TaxID=6978 RepID=A0ABQ8S4G2_PERAM|nr:hypothetical protein ANN_25754 [Periplaneta americana]
MNVALKRIIELQSWKRVANGVSGSEPLIQSNTGLRIQLQLLKGHTRENLVFAILPKKHNTGTGKQIGNNWISGDFVVQNETLKAFFEERSVKEDIVAMKLEIETVMGNENQQNCIKLLCEIVRICLFSTHNQYAVFRQQTG